MAEWLVYILRCHDGSLYTGITTDLERRTAVHNAGRGARALRGRLPVVPVWSRAMADRSAALREEARIKALTHAAKEQLVRNFPAGC